MFRGERCKELGFLREPVRKIGGQVEEVDTDRVAARASPDLNITDPTLGKQLRMVQPDPVERWSSTQDSHLRSKAI